MSERTHLVPSAAYWFNAAKAHPKEPNALLAMENAYNHVENALKAARDEAETLRARAEAAEAEFHKVQELRNIEGRARPTHGDVKLLKDKLKKAIDNIQELPHMECCFVHRGSFSCSCGKDRLIKELAGE